MDHPDILQCRLCLAPSLEQYASITDSAVRSKLDVVFKFELPLDASLPDVICADCSTKIDEFYHFHETVQTNQDQLKTAPMANAGLVLLFEVKEEPVYDAEMEEPVLEESSTAVAAVDQFGKDNDNELTIKPDPDEAEPIDIEDAQSKLSTRMPDDNWRIEQFFNGIGCSICSEKFETFGKLKKHSRNAHDQNASITCCGRKYFKQSYLIDHINTHQGSKHFNCELCKKNYVSKESLRLHNLQFHTKPEELPYQCNTCGKKFTMKGLLTAHLKHHVQVKCSVCDQTLASIQSLKVHMLSVHSEQPREATHVCHFCGQVYQQKQRLTNHINLQHLGANSPNRIQCAVCTKSVNKHYLKIHMRNAHSGENLQVSCDICRHVYANRRALTNHKYKIHAERKLECEICGKRFKLSKPLKEHRASHTDQQLYTCTVCDYRSNYNCNLYTHLKKKHPVELAEARARGETLIATQNEPPDMV